MGLLDGLAHVSREPWCSRGPRRALVAAIFRWSATRTGTIGSTVWTGVGLRTLHARTVHTALEYREGYRPGGCGGPLVPGDPSLTASQTAFGHRPICF